MLYNPAWSKPAETETDPLLNQLIAFLQRQPSGKVYIFDWPDEGDFASKSTEPNKEKQQHD